MATAGGGRGSGPERAFVRPLPDAGEVVLGEAESRHLVRVRRVRAGEPVVLFDGAGKTRLAHLTGADPRRAVLGVQGPYPDREPSLAWTLAVSIPEAGRADLLVATLAELGVARLVWLQAARTPAGRADLPGRRGERWGRLITEAAKVNGRSRLLEVAGVLDLGAVLARAPAAVLLDPDPLLPTLPALLSAEGAPPWLLVGPEGGFTDEEREAAREAGAACARLGAVALRVETAAIAAASVALAWGLRE